MKSSYLPKLITGTVIGTAMLGASYFVGYNNGSKTVNYGKSGSDYLTKVEQDIERGVDLNATKLNEEKHCLKMPKFNRNIFDYLTKVEQEIGRGISLHGDVRIEISCRSMVSLDINNKYEISIYADDKTGNVSGVDILKKDLRIFRQYKQFDDLPSDKLKKKMTPEEIKLWYNTFKRFTLEDQLIWNAIFDSFSDKTKIPCNPHK